MPRPSAWRTSSLMIATLRSRPPGCLPAPHPGLQDRGPGPGEAPDATAHRLPETGRPRRAGGDPDTGQDPDRKSLRHPWPTSTAPVPPTALPKQSTGAWSTYAASPWDSATSRTTPSAASSTPDASKTTWQQSPKPGDKPHLQHPQIRRASKPVSADQERPHVRFPHGARLGRALSADAHSLDFVTVQPSEGQPVVVTS